MTRALAIGCGLNSVGLEDIGDRRVTNPITDFGEFALNSVVSPRWILPGERQRQIDDHLANSWPPLSIPFLIRIVPFPGDQLSMPTQNRVRREQGTAEFLQPFAARNLPSTASRDARGRR